MKVRVLQVGVFDYPVGQVVDVPEKQAVKLERLGYVKIVTRGRPTTKQSQ